jgi:hypothetical protein
MLKVSLKASPVCWLDTPERKAFAEKIAALLAEPKKISTYQTDSYFDIKGMVETLRRESLYPT